VTVANDLESTSVPGRVHVSEATYYRARADCGFEPHDDLESPGRGAIRTFLVKDCPILRATNSPLRSHESEVLAPRSKTDEEQGWRIFVCYRRTDTAGHAGRLYDQLADRFGPSSVFMDIDTIRAGEDFIKSMDDAVSSAGVLIAVIGRGWLRETNSKESSESHADFVRIELATAFKRGVPVIPVLVQGAPMPAAHELPPDVSMITRVNALELSDARWRHDIDRLVRAIEKLRSRGRIPRRNDSGIA
jgi:hypothetical protein